MSLNIKISGCGVAPRSVSWRILSVFGVFLCLFGVFVLEGAKDIVLADIKIVKIVEFVEIVAGAVFAAALAGFQLCRKEIRARGAAYNADSGKCLGKILFLFDIEKRKNKEGKRLHKQRYRQDGFEFFHGVIPPFECYLQLSLRYSFMNSSRSPSITACMLPVSQPVRLSLTSV